MKGLVRILFVSALLLFGAATASPAAADPPTPEPGLPLQLALGDSWASGVGDMGESGDVPEGGYVPDLYETLKADFNCLPTDAEEAPDGCKHLQLLNLAKGGATTRSMINEQFPVAIPLLEARNRNVTTVEVITLHIGGNDVTGSILAACLGGPTLNCLTTIQAELGQYRTDLTEALSKLRNAAGPNARIVIGTYDNPIPTCQLHAVPGADLLGDIVLEGGVLIPENAGLHDVMRQVAEAQEPDVLVASVYGQLRGIAADWVGGNDCLHPDDSGYDKVAKAFEGVLGVGQSE